MNSQKQRDFLTIFLFCIGSSFLVAPAWAIDCNNNGVPDDQDIASCDGSAWCSDCNGNGIPDECDVATPPVRLFDIRRDVPVHDGPAALAVDDLDADGYLDLVVGEDNGGHVFVYYGLTDGSFGRTETYEISTRPSTSTSGFVIADFSGDHLLDFAVCEHRYGDKVSILYGQPSGGFGGQFDVTVGSNPVAIAIEDFDEDGVTDLAVACVHGDSISVLRGLPDGTFSIIQSLSVGDAPYGIAQADLDGDGHVDLVALNTYVSSLSVLFGSGDGLFGNRQDYVLGPAYGNGGPGALVAEKLNGDEWVDLAVSFQAEDKVVVLDGQLGGLFDAVNHRRDVPVGDTPWGIVAGDWNRDGFTDLATANAVSDSVTVLHGNGQGLFNIRQDYPVGAWPLNIAAADFDGDGWENLAVTCINSDTVSILYNNPGWGGSSDCDANGVPDECQPDCDNDGTPDICELAPLGTSPDCNANGVPDECECTTVTEAPEAEFAMVAKNRYLSFAPTNPGEMTALRVKFISLPEPFKSFEGQTMWIGQPMDVSEVSGKTDATPPTFKAAMVQCDPVYWDWGAGPVSAYGDAIVPGGIYEVQAVSQACQTCAEGHYSAALAVATTTRWGDVVGNSCSDPPDGVVNFNDISCVVDKFKNLPGAPGKASADIGPDIADRIIDFVDISAVVDAFRGRPYPYDGPQGCP